MLTCGARGKNRFLHPNYDCAPESDLKSLWENLMKKMGHKTQDSSASWADID